MRLSINCASALVLVVGCAQPTLAQELDFESFDTGFEADAGYVLGMPVPDQPGDWPEQWWSWYGDNKAQITDARVHSGAQAVAYPSNYTEIEHLGLLDVDPLLFPPATWQDSFWFYISSARSNSGEALRCETWSDYDGEGYTYQLFIWQGGEDNGFITDFEDYDEGNLIDQFGWYSWYGDVKPEITREGGHSGTTSVAFPENFCDIQHSALNGNPDLGPMTWQETFSVYISSDTYDGTVVLRSEPWNNWADTGRCYQLFLYRVEDGIADGWTPVLGAGALANDLRDEMGMDPIFDAFPTDQWWTVQIIADGATGRVLSVTATDEFGTAYEALDLDAPFSIWGDDLTDGDPAGETFTPRPERVTYNSEGGGVWLDDVSMHEVGIPPLDGWFPEVGWGGNDLRDDLGLPSDFLFDADKWWNIVVTADGEAGEVIGFKVADDDGNVYETTTLAEPFSSWGTPATEWAHRPVYVTYASQGDGVYLDDVHVQLVGGPDCPGDVDGDGDTDQSDLGILLASYDIDGDGDLDGDGDTDQSDLGILLADYECGT